MNIFLKKTNITSISSNLYKHNNISRFYSQTQVKLEESFTKIHGHYRHDGYNKIKTNKYDFNTVVKREQKTFKYWKNYMSMYYKEWEKHVNKSIIILYNIIYIFLL